MEEKNGKPESIDKRQLGLEDRFHICGIRLGHRTRQHLAVSVDGRFKRWCDFCPCLHRSRNFDRVHGNAGRILYRAAHVKESCRRLRSHQTPNPMETGWVYGCIWLCLHSLLLRDYRRMGFWVFLQNARRSVQGRNILAGFGCHIPELRRQTPRNPFLPSCDHRPDNFCDLQRGQSRDRKVV